MPESLGRGALVWMRRDLRVEDHAALHHALRSGGRVYCVFVFDDEILEALPARADRRVEFIRESLVAVDAALDAASRAAGGSGSGLIVRHGAPRDLIPALALELGVAAVHVNRDYEPQALRRDHEVAERLRAIGVAFHDYKDQVIFDKSEVLTRSGTPFSVFTPYRRAWDRALEEQPLECFEVQPWAAALAPRRPCERVPTLAEIAFQPSDLSALAMPTGIGGARKLLEDFLARIDRYAEARDFPAVKGVSYLSTHLRFGTVSIRELVRHAIAHGGAGAACWLNELVWRDFYHQVLWHHPRVVSQCFRPEFDQLEWADDSQALAAWRDGLTGYPIVDAAMRQLNSSGYMHNRLRMITASFLTKDLGIDWRLGERYFAWKLNDFDLAANNGGWQWAASTGCDAQPYFRIFNPIAQSVKFDPAGRFIRRYVPELARVPDRWVHAPWQMPPLEQSAAACRIGRDYPAPMVDHAVARELTLARFSKLRG